MRFKSRGVLLALVVVFAMSAVAAASASAALPEFKPVPTKNKFTSTSGKFAWYSPTFSMTCSKSTATGEITGASTVGGLVIKWTGCEWISGSSHCALSSEGAKEGEVVTDRLKGELGSVASSEAASGAGLLLEAETGSQLTTWIPSTKGCSYPKTNVEGSFVAEVSVTAKKQLTNAVVFAPGVKGGTKQKIREITVKRGTVKPKFTSWALVEISMEGTDEATFEEALEVT
jgi:hypothetical protein